jgi:hypothetical protein
MKKIELSNEQVYTITILINAATSEFTHSMVGMPDSIIRQQMEEQNKKLLEIRALLLSEE